MLAFVNVRRWSTYCVYFSAQQQFKNQLLSSQQQKDKILRRKMSGLGNKPNIVFVLGPPGAGKGTQCSKIVEHYNYVHLSAGDLLREERAKENSKVAVLIEECIRNGKIVPVEVTCSLLEKAMQLSAKNKFLIDGFPRNQDNLDGWNRVMADKVNFDFVLFFNCQENICVERCLMRGKNSGRSDDNEESLKKRINTYLEDSLPIIKHFEALGQVREIDASRNPDEVFKTVQTYFN